MKRLLVALATAVSLGHAQADEALLEAMAQPWTGDLDGMIERRTVRALVVPSRMQYWIDRGRQSGAEYELLKKFEEELNAKYKLKRKHIGIHVHFIPTARDELIPALVQGRGDIAAGILTITPERLQQVDFGAPFFRNVAEIVVTGPASPTLASIEDLAAQKLFVRRSSSYWTHLEALSERLRQQGRASLELKAAPEDLQDDDLLEMLNAGLVGVAVVDRYKAVTWARVFKRIKPREDLKVHEGGDIAWMIRKDSPNLKAEISAFAQKHGQDSAFGKNLVKKYTGSTRFVRAATSKEEMRKFDQTAEIFRKYSGRYDMDYLLVMAQGYQESRLDQNAKSPVGAIGVMQVMPATGRDMKTGDITQLDPNIHAGVKYIRYVQDTFFENQPMDAVNKTLFSFAAYNAGPGRVQELRARAEKRGLNPNVWFNNVELIAAERIGAETVTYVSNIYKYYVAYKLAVEIRAERDRERDALKKKP
ncbi:MAG TPA: transporter substrate-binding domain-containing protein [Burkholderiales bacterium]|nr:transporter substrate-binding domain-containing protein [Burkholderiales bacterium]